jgi:putative transcriptional regulator
LGYVILRVKISLHRRRGNQLKVTNRIKEIRLSKGISQVEMAEALQITRQTINAVEKHKYNPSLELALKMIKYFDVPIEELFTLEEDGK